MRKPDHIDVYGSIADRQWRQADGVNRADVGLKRFPRREGDAVFCAECDGAGYTPRTKWSCETDRITKCARCGGEGLEPKI